MDPGSNIELGTTDLNCSRVNAENFVFDAKLAAMTQFLVMKWPCNNFWFPDQTNDKIVILASAMPVGYDLDDFKSAAGVDATGVNYFDSNTVIYFAPDANGDSTSFNCWNGYSLIVIYQIRM